MVKPGMAYLDLVRQIKDKVRVTEEGKTEVVKVQLRLAVWLFEMK